MEENQTEHEAKNLSSKVFALNQFLEINVENLLLNILNIARYIFIVMMIVYLGQCFISLGYKMVSFTISQGALDFNSMKIILTDGLFILIVLAIVKTLFIQDGFDYAVTFLEISFVVLVRKLILLETDPSETYLLFVLGITSALFFILIVYIKGMKHKWEREKCEKCLQNKEK
ncbi:hypothetical protein [Sulfurospirillum sp. MES]|uniref:hypothetical protein n=1 Tax=Sulfurospirillum sp. MES TaxID=1565314 RepID=UPI0005432DEE|nr:hypothetical protein [Sulfurospirillum sp. MES]KHG34102.1 MAG: hypothetical protein OA34_07115 [Sulfurospirillum sp. MES]